MRSFCACLYAVCATFMVAQTSWAENDVSKLAAPIEQCIRGNAAKVERTIPDLYQATNFLVNGVCAAQLDAEYDRLMDLKAQKDLAELFKMCAQTKVDSPKDGVRPNTNPLCSADMLPVTTDPASKGEDLRAYGMPPHSAAATSLAARLLLDLRLAHTNSKSQ